MSTLITQYLGEGTAASRPATPSVAAGCIAFYYATDTSTLSVWNGSSWVAAGGGYNAGTPPTVVQSGHDVAGNKQITLGSAPINGNLLIAMTVNTPATTPGSGWTLLASNTSGTDDGYIYYKVAGAGESTTQAPLAANEAPGCMVIWEINGQAATWLVQVAMEAEQVTSVYAFSPVMGPLDQKLLFLGFIGLISTAGNFTGTYGVVQDQLVNTGSTRQVFGGHSTLNNYPTAQIAAVISASSSYKAMGLIITA